MSDQKHNPNPKKHKQEKKMNETFLDSNLSHNTLYDDEALESPLFNGLIVNEAFDLWLRMEDEKIDLSVELNVIKARMTRDQLDDLDARIAHHVFLVKMLKSAFNY